MQNVAFWLAKDDLLQAKTWPFEIQKAANGTAATYFPDGTGLPAAH